MRVIKGLILFCFSIVAVSACFDPPEFSDKPHIEFNSIKFKKEEGQTEELILSIDFKDGDGDLGLNASEDQDFPFNDEFFYLEDGTGDTIPIIAKTVEQTGTIYTILNDERLAGKLVTTRTRSMPNYSYLPAYDPNYSCLNYKTISTISSPNGALIPGILVPFSSIDDNYDIEDTLMVAGREYALITDRLLYKRNLNAFNIEVRFWQFENGSYVEYDWFRFNRCNDFFGQFLTSATSTVTGRAIEGTLVYTMANSSFESTFGSRAIKVSVRIRDRALNSSNTIESPIFELNEILVD